MSHQGLYLDGEPGRVVRPGRFGPGPTLTIDGVGRAEALGDAAGRDAYFARCRIGGLHAGQGQWSCAAFSTVIAVAPLFRRLQPDW